MIARAIAAAVLTSCALAARAAEYPTRPIRIVVPFTAGSASDLLARMIGPKLADAWGQQVVIDNRPSAGGTVAGQIVATYLVLVVGPNGPKSVKDLIAMAREKPGRITYGSSGIGSGTHYAAELF